MNSTENFWAKCSSCKKEIPFGAKYYLCTVSTCRHPRTGFRFCSSDCWDAHLGNARHREAWAEEAFAPKTNTHAATPLNSPQAPSPTPTRKIYEAKIPEIYPTNIPTNLETLVVVSKVKQFINDRSDFNTSQCCIDALSKKVAEIALKAIESARNAGRKTVMGRDIN